MRFRSSWRPSPTAVFIGSLLASLAIVCTAAAQGPLPMYVAAPGDFQPVSGGKVTFSPGPGQTVLLTPTVNAFTTFETAVAAANSNAHPRNIIVIAPGTFDVAVAEVRISKHLTVIGAGPTATTLRPTVSTGNSYNTFILVEQGVSVQITQLAIDGQAPVDLAVAPAVSVRTAIAFAFSDPAPPAEGIGLLDHVAFRNIRTSNSVFDGVAVAVHVGRVTVSQSTFTNIGLGGAMFGGSLGLADGAFLGNTYTGKGPGNTRDIGLEISGQGTVTAQGNIFTNALGTAPLDFSGGAVAIFVHTNHPSKAPTALIQRNTVDNNREGIRVGNPIDIGFSERALVTITENNILNNADTYAIFSPEPFGAGPPVEAPNNFWGSPNGPFNALHNPAGDPTNQVSDVVAPLTPFAATAFPLTFTPPPASIALVHGTIGGKVTRGDTQAPQPGVTVFLDVNGTSTIEEGEVTAVTDSAGAYTFSRLAVAQAGTRYTVGVFPDPLVPVQNLRAANLTPTGPTATIDFVLTSLATTTIVTAAPNPGRAGQTTLLVATVTPSGATGTVTFQVDGQAVTAALLTNGHATVSLSAPSLPAGTHQVIASYSGNHAYTPSTSTPVFLTIEGAGPGPDPGPAPTFTQYFAEGSTGFFQTDIGLLNASTTDPAHVTVTLFPELGAAVSIPFTLDPLARRTIDLNAVLGDVAGVSTLVESDRPVAATRHMTWGQPAYGSTFESGISTASTTWYFAEGATAVFSLYFLLENPGSVAAHVTFTHLLEGGAAPVAHTTIVPAFSRRTIFINAVPGLEGAALSTAITSDLPIVAERAMYLNTSGRLWEGGAVGRGAETLGTSWSFAEGATGFFQTYVLLGNPNGGEATATVQYQLPDGTTIEKAYPVAGQSRRTIDVRLEDARLAATAVAMTVASSLPIVAERAMWWGDPWNEGSVALGSTETGSVWGIGEGAEGGPNAESTFVLVSNGSANPGTVRFTVAYDDGTRERREYALLAHARLTVRVAEDFSLANGRRFSVLVESLTTDVPITVECARYQSAGSFLDGGGAALATRIRQ